MNRLRTIVLAAFSLLAAGPCVAAEQWDVVAPDSRIGFVATYEDIPFEAWFDAFQADIRFSPDDLEDAVFEVRIEVGSVDSNSVDRDEGMQREAWFATDEHPMARFRADRFEKLSGNRFRATGPLELKGTSKTISVPFTWERVSDEEAVLTAETTLQRGEFNIGSGEWAEDDTIGFDVTVKARLKLTRQP